jgi:L-2-hydroxyglutarate oxidase LhgO
MKTSDDYLIIGAGILGFSIGISLLEYNPKLKVRIVEKEESPGAHASGRNSGVLHAGFYYSPESLKAKFCKEGNLELKRLAAKHDVAVNNVGKVVVTKNLSEVARLENLFRRGLENGVDVELLNAQSLKRYEPLAQTVEKFLWSPTTAIADPKWSAQSSVRNAGLATTLSCKDSAVLTLEPHRGRLGLLFFPSPRHKLPLP